MQVLKSISIIILAVVFPILLFGCKGNPQNAASGDKDAASQGDISTANGENVEITTTDGFTLTGTFTPATGEGPHPGVLLVHQLGLDRRSWDALVKELTSKGISSLSIDLRGHGESTAGNTIDYMKFTTEEWAGMINDLVGGMAWLRNRSEVDPSKLGIIGASIGANMAIIHAASEIESGMENPVKAIVVLSPGMLFHGYKPLDPKYVRTLGELPVLIISSSEDGGNHRAAQGLSQGARGGELIALQGKAHGTEILDGNPDLIAEIVDWLPF